jgi:hypothetical protein
MIICAKTSRRFQLEESSAGNPPETEISVVNFCISLNFLAIEISNFAPDALIHLACSNQVEMIWNEEFITCPSEMQVAAVSKTPNVLFS